MKPVLFVTNHVPPDRAGAFAALHEKEGIRLALFGGRSHHATDGIEHPDVPHVRISEREVAGLAGEARAVVCGTVGRAALPAAYRGARRAGVPFVLWSALWAHPRAPAFMLAGSPLLRYLYHRADAVVTYGPHVSDFVSKRGARNIHVAPQAVDNDFWSQAIDVEPHPFNVVFVGRAARYKGLPELLEAWSSAGLEEKGAELSIVEGNAKAVQLRNIYAGSDVLVMPAISTPRIREPWGLVANEAMNQGLPVIATNAVGAVAGGLIRHERNGLVVDAGDTDALANALIRLRDDPDLRARLGATAREDVAAYTYEAWANGFSSALQSVGASAVAAQK